MFGSARRALLEQKARSRFKRPRDLVFANAAGHPGVRRIGHGASSCPPARAPASVSLCAFTRPSVTLDVYAHLFREGLAVAAERFDPLARGRREVDERPERVAADVAASGNSPTAIYVK